MIFRKIELEFLLRSAFDRTTISLSEGQLKLGGDWYTNCTFRNIDLEHYTDLFRHVLLSDSEKVMVIDKNNNLNNYIERGKVVEGLKAYFNSYGVRNQIDDAQEERARLFDILTTVVLPVILLSKNGYEGYKTEAEDIEEQLLRAMEYVEQKPFSTGIVLKLTPSCQTIEIYDPNYSEDECDYEVEILISHTKAAKFQEYNKWLIQEVACPLVYGMEQSVCDEVCMKQYISSQRYSEWDTNPDAPVEGKSNCSYSDHVLKLHLSTFEPEKNLIEGTMVKYKTKIDQYRLANYKGYNQYQFENEIYEKGREHVGAWMTRRNGEAARYCNQLFLLMQDLLNRAFSLNMKNLISGEKIAKNKDSGRQLSIDDCNKELEKIVVNRRQVISAIRSLHQNDQDYAEQCYLVIQSILQKHIQMLNHVGANISHDFACLLDRESLEEHMKELKKYIRKLETLLMIQKTVMQDKPYLYKEIETITDLYTYRDPELLANYKAALDNYYKALKREISGITGLPFAEE